MSYHQVSSLLTNIELTIIYDISKKFNNFQLINDQGIIITNSEEFIQSNRLCFTNCNTFIEDIKSSKYFRCIHFKVTNDVIFISNKEKFRNDNKSSPDTMEIYYPNYQYPFREYHIKRSDFMNRRTFNYFFTNCIEFHVIPDKIIFK